MQIMGDYPLRSKNTMNREDIIYECVVTIIKACFEHPVLIDEVYCHVIKQVTNNRSTKRYEIRDWSVIIITFKGEGWEIGKCVMTVVKKGSEHPVLIVHREGPGKTSTSWMGFALSHGPEGGSILSCGQTSF